MDQLKFNRITKYICWGLEVAFFITLVSLCIAVHCKNEKIDSLNKKVFQQELVIEQITNKTK